MTCRLSPRPACTLTEFQRPSGRGPARALESPGALVGATCISRRGSL
tara:strand:- start:568 stop:708 length:141 start_codon:yes stop_codon:yes gene_type:complete